MANDKGITIKMRTWVVLLLIVAAAGFATYKIVRYKKDVATLEQILKEKNGAIKTFTVIVNGLKEEVSEAELLVIDSQRALKKSEQYAERLKALNIRHVSTIGSLELRLAAMQDSLEVHNSVIFYDTVVTEVVQVDDTPMLPLPASFGFQDEWVTSWGIITEDGMGESGFTIDKLPIEIVLGSRGFFKPVYVSQVGTSNPHVTVTKQQFIVTDQTKSRTPWLIGGGFVLGVSATTALFLLTR